MSYFKPRFPNFKWLLLLRTAFFQVETCYTPIIQSQNYSLKFSASSSDNKIDYSNSSSILVNDREREKEMKKKGGRGSEREIKWKLHRREEKEIRERVFIIYEKLCWREREKESERESYRERNAKREGK